MKKVLITTVAVALVVVMLFAFCACTTPSEESVTKKYKDNGYTAIGAVKDGVGTMTYTKIDANLADSQAVVITWFEKEEDAKSSYDKAVGENKDAKKLVKRKGNAVAVGSEDAIKLF